MTTQEQLIGTWNELKGRIEEEWGEIADDEWTECQGSVDRIVGLIQRRTGEARQEIQQKMEAWCEQSGHVFSDATAAVQDYASQAVEFAKQNFGEAQDVVKRHPAESVIVSFGTGLLLGVVLGLVSKSR